MRLSKTKAALAAAMLVVLGLVVSRWAGDGEPSARSSGRTAGSTTPLPTATTPPATTGTSAQPSYALAPTRRCLRDADATVSTIRSRDPRLRALGDLAQRTSLEVHLDGRTLGLAFGNTSLLEDLLQVPDDPYRLEVRRNALLMYEPSARSQAAVVRGCLRS